MFDGDCLYLLLLIIPFAPVVSVPASVAGGCPPSLSGCRQGLRMAPHDDDGDDGDGWTVGDVPPVFEMVTSEDGVFLTDIIRARGDYGL